jgi:hydroxymethylpyrimidine/phosphomethylpyrimidine kinase
MATVKEVKIKSVPAIQASLPTVLTVAGSDCSGGAGIEADVKTITAHGCYALTAISALTAENTQRVNSIEYTRKEALESIFKSNFEDISIDVIKTGMLTEDAIDILADYVSKYHVGKPMVIDPVMVSTTGAQLSKDEVLQHGINKLMKGVSLITPNLEEARKILKLFDIEADIQSLEDLKKYVVMIQEKTKASNVLLKGGHCPWTEDGKQYITDVLYISSTKSTIVFKSDYVDTENTHGTGCTLASAIASNLASGLSLEDSVENGIRYVHSGIISAAKLGHGNGPLNHVFHIASPSFRSGSGSVFVEGGFVDYLTNHPTVKPIWTQYLNHPFVEKVANGTLPKSKFVRYISQDYPYLVNYCKVHAVLCSIAPDHDCMNREVEILNDIKRELSKHGSVLESQGITNFDSLKMSDACKEYADYLTRVAEGRDWLEICVAMAPCLLGYYYAASNVKCTTSITDYKDWIETYTSEWYHDAVIKGKINLERHSPGITFEKAAKLVKIFSDVCLLEVNFWNDGLNYEEEQ